MDKLFSKEEEQRIVEAIRQAERQTSGELRVHIDEKAREDVMAEALRVFQRLNMHRTKARNGVLILLAPGLRRFAIIGDEGIDAVVPEDFWESERNLMQQFFRRGEFCEGLVQAIGHVGEKLKAFFPREADDENELPDEISYE